MREYPDKKNYRAFEIVLAALRTRPHQVPFVIGITGAGGAGKTTFANNIVLLLGAQNCLTIDLDDYLLSREERGKLEITGYHPEANKLFEAREHIEQLKQRVSVLKPRYDHSTGQSLSPEEIQPKEVIVIEGVTTLYKELREVNDVAFFLDALEETQIKSRIERDVKHRGYTLEQAISLHKTLLPMYKQFIEPTKKHADVVFQVGPDYIMHPIHSSERFK